MLQRIDCYILRVIKFSGYILLIFDFIIPKNTTKKSQVIDKKPNNNPIQGRCY